MTPRERAEKLARTVASLLNIDPKDKSEWVWQRHGHAVIAEIESSIREAVEEGMKTVQCYCVQADTEKAKAEAYEDAAKILTDECLKEEFPDMNRPAVVALQKIRAKAKELGK
jgi:hypothetical protein